ncbi:MAG: aldehyde dehydrogenase [Thermoanaerobaculia bacterium]
MLRIPLLRAGEPYTSLNTVAVADLRTGEPVVEVSHANAGLIAKDLTRQHAERPLDGLTTAELMAICVDAARRFTDEELPLGDDGQGPDDYLRQLASTTGLPEVMGQRNMEKIRFVLAEMETVLSGLTRGLDWQILDKGFGVQDGRTVSYRRESGILGAVLPSNSPGVHSLWLPAVALKIALALKPGRQEPWTPYRVCQALLAAGLPPAAVGFYPTDYNGAAEILLRARRSLLFGDRATVEPWENDPGVQIHGPGWSKVLLCAEESKRWPDHLETIAASVADNGGRSCINASGVRACASGRELAEGLAERLARIEARPLDDPEAALAAFPSREAAEAMSAHLDDQLAGGGAEDLTAKYRDGNRVAEAGGCWFVLPTVVWCDRPDHSLAQAEFLFPFVSVVEVPEDELVSGLSSTLVATLLAEGPELPVQAMASPAIDRLNLGSLPTSRVSWDQPHEGNLFEFLYRQRAFQSPELTAATG